MKSSALLRIAGVCGFLAVALGAFGAHGLKGTLAAHGTAAIWETASLYHLIHAVALLAIAMSARVVSRWIPILFVAGIAVFSGTLYVLAVTGLKWLGAITPLGGLCFLIGWAWLAFGSED